MKKSIRLLSVLLVLFAGSLVTSCDVAKELAEELAGPENTWCTMYVEYGNDENKVNLEVNAIYVDEDYTGTGSKTASLNLSPEITLKPGITFVVALGTNSDNTLIQGLTNSTYILKHFDKATAVETADDSEETSNRIKFKGSKTNWTLLYNAKADLRNPDNQNKLPRAPHILSYAANATPANSTEGFSWSKLLKTYLLSTITDKLE